MGSSYAVNSEGKVVLPSVLVGGGLHGYAVLVCDGVEGSQHSGIEVVQQAWGAGSAKGDEGHAYEQADEKKWNDLMCRIGQHRLGPA